MTTIKQQNAAAQNHQKEIDQAKKSDTGRSCKRSQKIFKKPSLAKQSFRDSTDINTIMATYAKTGQAPLNNKQPRYIENTGITYHQAMQQVLDAQEAFAALPAKVRDKFDHDPSKYLEFLENPENQQEAFDLGLSESPPAPADETEELVAPLVPDSPPETP